MKQGTPEWLADRRAYVGASEVAAIVGVDPWRGEYELALMKRGLSEPEPTNEAQAWGHRVQSLALDMYPDLTGRRVKHVHTTTQDRRHPHVRASLDGRCIGERRGVEVKLTRAWDEPPQHVVIQCQAQMGVCGLDAVDVMRVGMGYQAPAIFTIERDDALATDLLDMAEDWYVRYVLGDELPPVDGSRAAMRHLDRFRGEAEAQATEEQEAFMASLRSIRRQVDELSRQDGALVAALKASMAGTGTLVGDHWRVTWSAVKPRVTTDWKLVAAAYRRLLFDSRTTPLQELDAIEALHTTTGEPTTRFAPVWQEEDET